MDFTREGPSALSAWNKARGFRAIKSLILELANPHKDSYDPLRALQLLENSIRDKWMAEQFARTEKGIERSVGDDLEHFLPKPIVDNGPRGVEQQVRDNVELGLRYMNSPTMGWEPEYHHVIARTNLGFTHAIEDDTVEQREAWRKEELKIIYQSELETSVYELSDARDAGHHAYLQGNVDKWQRKLDNLDAPPQEPGLPTSQPSLASKL